MFKTLVEPFIEFYVAALDVYDAMQIVKSIKQTIIDLFSIGERIQLASSKVSAAGQVMHDSLYLRLIALGLILLIGFSLPVWLIFSPTFAVSLTFLVGILLLALWRSL